MLTDPFGRKISYLRVSVTDRCNLNCVYCKPGGFIFKPHKDMLRYEQIEEIVRVAAGLGINKVRLTGGEPLVRRGIESLVSEIASTEGIREVTMTTNGVFLTSRRARHLKKSGLNRVNISLDTLDPEKFRTITRGGEIKDVLKGIDAAVEAGLMPVKVNMVVFEDTAPEEIESMRSFCGGKGLVLQTIKKFSLDEKYDLSPVETDRPHACRFCIRLRLTADGYFKPCLFSDREIKVDFSDIEGSIREAVGKKPESGAVCKNRFMHQIGG